MIKKLLIIVPLIMLGAITALIYFKSIQIQNPAVTIQSETVNDTLENVNYSASFAIYTNGTFRIFTDSMYHDLNPDVYIESSNPNLIRIKQSNTTWKDFFSTLPFEINQNCLVTGTKQTFCTNNNFVLQFYINGELTSDALNQIINPGDKLLVTYDVPSSPNISTQIQSVPDSM